MAEHISTRDIERYRKRAMAPKELFATSSHLAACDICYSRYADDDILEPTYTFLTEDLKAAESEELDHPDSGQMSAYLDQNLSWADREIVETHLELCSQCSAAADKLRLARIEGQREKLSELDSAPPRPRGARPSRSSRWRIPAQVAAAAAAVALLVWLVTLPLRTRVAGLQAEVERLQRDNESYEREASKLSDLEARLEQYRKENERLRQESGASQTSVGRLEQEPASPRPTVALRDEGGPVVMNERGDITGIDSLSGRYLRLVRMALTTGQVKAPAAIAELRGKPGQLMGKPESRGPLALLAPACVVIENDRPTFRWQPLDAAGGYTVTVLDSDSNRVVTSPLLHTSEWKIPIPLKRGGVYSWQVKAIKGGKEIVSPSGAAPDVRFKVLEGAKVGELDRARKEYAGSHLALGIIYAHMGLIDEAGREIESLARSNPASALIQSLLRSLQNLRC